MDNKIKQLLSNFNTKESKLCPFPSGILNINLKQLELNILKLTRFANKTKRNNVKFMFPIKANAYGHGMIPVAKFVEAKKLCDFFGVANLKEARQLRENKIKTPVLILGQSFSDKRQLQYIIKNKIEQTISDKNFLLSLDVEARKLKTKTKVHLFIDTGMGREGIIIQELPETIEMIKKCKNISLAGVMTHFSVADDLKPERIKFTQNQIETFKDMKKLININFPHNNILFHSSNSAGTIHYEQALFDMIRPGIASYGYPENDLKLNLKPVMELKSKICLIKKYPKNYSLGYGQTYKTKKEDEVIGIIPIGYGDGLNRLLSNQLTPIINNKKRKCVGRISMDQFSVAVDKNTKINDEVIIIGELDGISNNANDLAKSAKTITYEILCNLGNSKRIRHEYSYENN